jgi:hypothetical protein
MPRIIKETPSAQRRLGELIDMYSDRSDRMIKELITGRENAKELIRDNNFIGNNEHEDIDNRRYDYQWVVFYVGAESIRLCYLVEPDRLVVFWYWRSNDPLDDPRLRGAIAVHRS